MEVFVQPGEAISTLPLALQLGHYLRSSIDCCVIHWRNGKTWETLLKDPREIETSLYRVKHSSESAQSTVVVFNFVGSLLSELACDVVFDCVKNWKKKKKNSWKTPPTIQVLRTCTSAWLKYKQRECGHVRSRAVTCYNSRPFETSLNIHLSTIC